MPDLGLICQLYVQPGSRFHAMILHGIYLLLLNGLRGYVGIVSLHLSKWCYQNSLLGSWHAPLKTSTIATCAKVAGVGLPCQQRLAWATQLG